MLDLEDRELVDQLAWRHLDLDRTAHDCRPARRSPAQDGRTNLAGRWRPLESLTSGAGKPTLARAASLEPGAQTGRGTWRSDMRPRSAPRWTHERARCSLNVPMSEVSSGVASAATPVARRSFICAPRSIPPRQSPAPTPSAAYSARLRDGCGATASDRATSSRCWRPTAPRRRSPIGRR